MVMDIKCVVILFNKNYLVLLTEVHIKHLGITSRPFDSMKSCPSGHGLLCCGVLRRQDSKSEVNRQKHTNCRDRSKAFGSGIEK